MKDDRTVLELAKKLFSRKLLVFVVGTALLLTGKVSETIWLYISMVYVGANVAQSVLNNIVLPIKKKLTVKEETKEEENVV